FKKMFTGFQCTVPWLEQAVLTRFMMAGHWEKHLRKVCLVKKKKHDIFVNTVMRLFGNKVHIHGHNAGLHLLLEFPNGPDENTLVAAAEEHGVHVYPASTFWVDRKSAIKNCLLIGYGTLSEKDIVDALEILNTAWSPVL
ncbi:MAG: PLP-dependent aminotransferase family protein, partial [Desulfovibrio sp.]|nr:PLP-dependent aminotransferase family protein [Desulfovibrio sp.]